MLVAAAILISPDGWPAVRRLTGVLRGHKGANGLELVFVYPAGSEAPALAGWAHLLPVLLPLCLFLLCVETAGAAAGYLWGAGGASRRITAVDFHRYRHMSARDREEWDS